LLGIFGPFRKYPMILPRAHLCFGRRLKDTKPTEAGCSSAFALVLLVRCGWVSDCAPSPRGAKKVPPDSVFAREFLEGFSERATQGSYVQSAPHGTHLLHEIPAERTCATTAARFWGRAKRATVPYEGAAQTHRQGSLNKSL
jgi:hypothetical protein